jgi:hypothetical protein
MSDALVVENGLIKTFSQGSNGGNTPYVGLSGIEPVGSHTQATVSGTVVTLSRPDGTNKILIQSLDQNIRVTIDGTTPTTTLGFQIKAGDPAVIINVAPRTIIKFISETGSASVQYLWGT